MTEEIVSDPNNHVPVNVSLHEMCPPGSVQGRS